MIKTYTPMYSRIFILGILMFLLCNNIEAQLNIKGIVSDIEKRPLINATIYKLNRVSEGYAITSYDGRFEIKTAIGDTLVVSCIGFEDKNIEVTERFLKISLELKKQEENIVTGLGLSRSEQELGYAIQSINKEDIEYSKTHNFMHALQGRAVGIRITSSSAGPSAAVSTIIRGEGALSGRSQPLIVLNGMPITSDLFSSGDGLNGSSTIDFGNASQILSVDDIQSISILRGASAAIAYGSRAANGVILVTTKNVEGKEEGWNVRLNTSFNLETPLKMPNYQNEYGFGGYGKYSYNGGTTYTGDFYDAFGENWGPRTNGTAIKQWNSNGEAIPFTASGDNVKDFYRIGMNTNNNIALTYAGKASDFRLSFSSLYKSDIVPNSNLHKNTMLASFGQRVGDKVNFRANALYTMSGSDNIPSAGYDESSSIAYGFLWFPRNGSIKDYENYWKAGAENEQQSYAEELWVNNPWMVVNENTNSFLAHRFIADAVLSAEILPFLSARFRGNADIRNEARYFNRAYSTKGIPFGSYEYNDIKFSELNIEGLITAKSKTDKPIRISGTMVFNMMRQNGEFLKTKAPQLNVPSIYNLGNTKTALLVDEFKYAKGINSLFGTFTGSYKTMVHLEISGRSDWYSTLTPGPFFGAYYYPSATLSAVLTEMFKLPSGSPLTFAKIRAAIGSVQADANPYLLRSTYDYDNTWGQYTLLANNPQLNNSTLGPERTQSIEAGFELRFFDNRLSLDATYYGNRSQDLIVEVPTPISSGYTSKIFNSGRIRNQGVELMLKATPIKTENISWEIAAHASYNENKVLSLADGLNSYPIVNNLFPNDGGNGLAVEAQVGKPLGQLTGFGFQRDDNGDIIHQNGLPLLTTERISGGSSQPDWLVGLSNTIRYNNFSLSFLFDGQIGGKIFSRTHALANTGGIIKNNDDPNLALSSLDGRREYDITYNASGQPIYTLVQQGGVVGPGVMDDGNGNMVPNTVSVPTRDYFYAYYGNGFNRDNIESALFDATFIKLREVRLSYTLPNHLLKKVNIKNVTISLVGRNLALFSATPTIDPETFSIRNNQIVHGVESAQLPSTRSFGINLNLEF